MSSLLPHSFLPADIVHLLPNLERSKSFPFPLSKAGHLSARFWSDLHHNEASSCLVFYSGEIENGIVSRTPANLTSSKGVHKVLQGLAYRAFCFYLFPEPFFLSITAWDVSMEFLGKRLEPFGRVNLSERKCVFE